MYSSNAIVVVAVVFCSLVSYSSALISFDHFCTCALALQLNCKLSFESDSTTRCVPSGMALDVEFSF